MTAIRTQVSAWSDIGVEEIFYAYRKAKADCFFEKSICIAQRFAEYEGDLPNRLLSLLQRLQAGEIDQLLTEGSKNRKIVAKKLGLLPKPTSKKKTNGHGFFSDPRRAFERLRTTHELVPEFRLVGDFSVDMHVLSALWVNLVGHKFDQVLSPSAYGSRLRRYRPEPGSPSGTVGQYHMEAIGSFQPYFGPYKAWRERGLQAIREELQADRPVVAVSMDLTSYYHRIDPSFLANDAFHKDLGIELSAWDRGFTSAFVRALNLWADGVVGELSALGCDATERRHGGVPIGLSMVRLAANVLLAGLDRDIQQGLAPVYYGRYVDDLFLVIRDPGNISDADGLLRFISARTEYFPESASGRNRDVVSLRLPASYRGMTSLALQQTKQKVFFLQGRGGVDLLDNIESQIRSVSSERRLMSSPDRLETMASAQVLTAAAHASEEADTLRRADGLSVRRLGWSIQLRAVETLSRDLRADSWRKERDQFYDFAHNHILRPDRVLDHIDYLPRLLSLAIALTDWPAAHRLVIGTLTAIAELREHSRKAKVNGAEVGGTPPEIWDRFTDSVRGSAADAILRSIRWGGPQGGMRPLNETALALCELVGIGGDAELIEQQSIAIRECDWAKAAYKDHLRRDAKRHRPAVDGEIQLYGVYRHEEEVRTFLSQTPGRESAPSAARIAPTCAALSDGAQASLLPYLFPTRPYTAQEVSLFLPNDCVFGITAGSAARRWARYVRALRGVWVWPSLVEDGGGGSVAVISSAEAELRFASIGRPHAGDKVRLGISSLHTTEKSFADAASGKRDLSRERYGRLETIVNDAIRAKPRPTHLLLPELAIPERWIDTVSGLLREAGISLVAGLDYHLTGERHIHSEAVLVLTDDRLGFPSTVQIRQAKSLPAAGEEETLLKLFGREWLDTLEVEAKPVYSHKGFCFGVLVCSELQNVLYRQGFQGNVDCVMVLSWNKDLETFAALVESASLDVHAHIALVNNRQFGDSRVRTPAKANHARDACRLRGGKNEHVVVVDLEIGDLRAFQSRDRRWPSDDDKYKPVPEGFRIAPFRRSTPR